MKLQKLIIHNIASIEDATIDFSAEPLSNNELFLITGKTGSGKSTILDAICLALYANTPRLKSTNMQGDVQDGAKSLKINDPRQLMRHNTSDAFVSLTFLGNNQTLYEATWSIARAHNKLSGNIQDKKWNLKNLHTGTVLSKVDEITSEIAHAVGLDFNQFCRTTLLAQGEFTRFLNSKDEEKAEILEKITGVDIYTKIGKKIYDITASKKMNWETAQQKVNEVQLLSDDEITKYQEEIIHFKEDDERLKSQKESLNKKLVWLNNQSSLNKKIEDAQKSYQLIKEKIESDDYKRNTQLISLWKETSDARVWLNDIIDARDEQKKQKNELTQLFDDFKKIKADEQWYIHDVTNLQEEIENLTKYIDDQKEKADTYEKKAELIQWLKNRENLHSKIKKENNSIQAEETRQRIELKPTSDKLQESYDKAEKDVVELEKSIKQQEEQLQQTGLSTLRKAKEGLQQQLSSIQIAQDRMETLEREKKNDNNAKTALKKQLSSIEELEKQKPILEAKVQEAKIRLEACQKFYEKQRESIDKWAQNIRSKLQIGDVCPVCQQKITSVMPHEEDLDLLYKQAEKSLEEVEKEYEQLTNELNALNANIQSSKESYKLAKDTFENNHSLEECMNNALQACKKCFINELSDITSSQLSEYKDHTTNELNTITSQITIAEEIEKELENFRRKADESRKVKEQGKEELDAVRIQINQSQQSIQSSKANIQTYNDEIIKTENQLEHDINDQLWEKNWKENSSGFIQELEIKAKEYSDKQKELQNKEHTRQKNLTVLTNLTESITEVLKLMPEWNIPIHDSSSNPNMNILSDINNNRSKIAVCKAQLIAAEKKEQEKKELIDTFFMQHTDISREILDSLLSYKAEKISEIEREQAINEKEAIEKQSILDQLQKEQAELIDQKPDLEESESIAYLTEKINETEKQQLQINEKKVELNLRLEENKKKQAQLKELINDTNTKYALYNKWSRINSLFGDATGKNFRKIAQSYVLSSLIYSANRYMKSLSDRYILKIKPGTFVILLEDAYQGYVQRAASTISGGESFLVSLSLALALSDIGQQLSVDTLFIDEGFGTLSGEPLQKAINTLRTLHSKSGRRVGIISHVEELKERINVQIQVLQEGNHSDSKIIITS